MGKFNPNETDIPTIIPITISVFVSFLYILLHTYAAIATVRRTSDDISKNDRESITPTIVTIKIVSTKEYDAPLFTISAILTSS